MQGVRRGAAAIYKYLIALFAVAVVVQIFLAGLGIFGALPEEGESVTSERFDDKFEPHSALGFFLLLGSLLLLILILIAWTGPRSIGATFGLFALVVVQMILAWTGEDAPGIAALHPVNALVILGLSGFLARSAWRGNLLVPPSELRGAAPPPAPAA
jgi:Family of unknown function (DUF6220)